MTSDPEQPPPRRASVSDRRGLDGAKRRPAGPRTPSRAGSTRTSFSISPAAPPPIDTSGTRGASPVEEKQEHTPPPDAGPTDIPSPTTGTRVSVSSAAPTPITGPEPLPGYDGYRSPEAVIEHVEEQPEGTLPPGIVDATFDNKSWDTYDADLQAAQALFEAAPPERPQIGPGKMAKYWFEGLHPHPLWQPVQITLPQPPAKSPIASPTATMSPLAHAPPALGASATATTETPTLSAPPITVEDVWDALPGGRESHEQWFFCSDCWGWFHIATGKGELPSYPSHDARTTRPRKGESEKEEAEAWWLQHSRLRDLSTSRLTAPHEQHHFHSYDRLLPPRPDVRIPRVTVDGLVETFSHLDPAYGIVPPQLVDEEVGRERKTELSASCATDVWVSVDGPMGGQLPKALALEFTDEKRLNPGPGYADGVDSAIDAWALVITLLQNPLFRDKRGWVKMQNATFSRKIGASLRSHILLHRIGFSCKESDEGYQVGPFVPGDLVTYEHFQQMSKYMLRSWVEVTLFLQELQRRNKKDVSSVNIRARTVGEALDPVLELSKIPEQSVPFGSAMEPHIHTLGLSVRDTINTIDMGYDLQVSDDVANVRSYLGALEALSHINVPGIDQLRIKVGVQRSLDRYTGNDIEKAYNLIGLDAEYIDLIMVARDDLPAEHIYQKHREAMERATDADQRKEVSNALLLIGQERKDTVMQQLGRNGGTYLSLDQAYSEFNLSRDSNIDNEMLILQYETWIADRPSRADHYRLALSVIANAPGEERPQLQAFLSGKDISQFQGPVRRDIPAGLKNIGNTCYLNSVLQFLYALKPIRDAVTSFENKAPEEAPLDEDEKAREKRVKTQSSRRFVEMLGGLFEQMYDTDQSAVTPQEELARLAILPIDLVEQRGEVSAPTKNRVTIDSLPTVLSHSPTSSGAATAADTAPPSPTAPLSPSRTTSSPPSSMRRGSVLGKRASEDRESSFGGSEERLRRVGRDKDLIEFDSSVPVSPTSTSDDDVHMAPSPTREGSELAPPDAGLSQLGLASPLAERPDQTSAAADLGIVTPATTPPPADEGAERSLVTQEAAPAQPSYQAPAGPPPLPPRRRSLALVAAEKFGLQQDAAEILINVLSQLELAFDHPQAGEGNLVQRLFSAKFRQQMLLESGDGLHETHSPVDAVFTHPIIGVEEDGKDLYDCLAELYLGGAEVEYEGKKGFKMDLLDELPPALYIQMRRSQYDFVKGRQTKTNTHVPFGRTLVMDRFLANADPEKRERSIACTRQMMRLRARRHELKNHKPMSIPDTYRFVGEALASDAVCKALGLDSDIGALDSDISPALLDALKRKGSDADEEIKELERKLVECKNELEDMWRDECAVEYELVSVFVHGGTGTGGHYWTYQADLPVDGDKFFYYSDDNVKDVPSADVFADKSAQGVSPALLCYVRKGQDLVETLHRRPAPPESVPDSAATSGPTTPYDLDTPMCGRPADRDMASVQWSDTPMNVKFDEPQPMGPPPTTARPPSQPTSQAPTQPAAQPQAPPKPEAERPAPPLPRRPPPMMFMGTGAVGPEFGRSSGGGH